MTKFKDSELKSAYEKLCEKQDQLEPLFTFTLIRDTLRYSGNGGAQNIIKKLIELGWVEEVDGGNSKKYRMLKGK